jgi:hypothetical protein
MDPRSKAASEVTVETIFRDFLLLELARNLVRENLLDDDIYSI